MDCLVLSSPLFGSNLVTELNDSSRSVFHVQCVTFNTNILCLDSIGLPYLINYIDLPYLPDSIGLHY